MDWKGDFRDGDVLLQVEQSHFEIIHELLYLLISLPTQVKRRIEGQESDLGTVVRQWF